MEKIVLTDKQIVVVEHNLKMPVGYEPDGEEMDILCGVLDIADHLMEELDAYDELDDSLLKWFYNKYKEQQAQNV